MAEKRPTVASIAEEMAEMKRRLDLMEAAAAEVQKASKETHDKVAQLFDAFMVPEPGQDHGFLHRTAKMVNAVESGERVAGWAVKIAAVFAAIGVIAASLRVGIWPDSQP
jgi:hypothetical protein